MTSKNPEVNREIRRRADAKLRADVIQMYGARCNCRGCPVWDWDILTLDHVMNDGAERRGGLAHNMSEWRNARAFPDTKVYQLLCANCHLAKTKGIACVWHRDIVLARSV